MTTSVEAQAPVVGDAPPEKEAPVEKAAVKEKKVRVPKEKKPKQTKTASHPPYFQMIKEALLALSDNSGSSPYAIAKFMEEKHKAVLPANFKKIMALQLKNSVSRGKLVKIKASYKLSEAGKKDKATAKAAKPEKKTAAKPTQAAAKAKRETRASNKKTEKKAKAVKKKVAVAAKPKQPKSIKSPAAKKAKKLSA